jgi:hypothetical protein
MRMAYGRQSNTCSQHARGGTASRMCGSDAKTARFCDNDFRQLTFRADLEKMETMSAEEQAMEWQMFDGCQNKGCRRERQVPRSPVSRQSSDFRNRSPIRRATSVKWAESRGKIRQSVSLKFTNELFSQLLTTPNSGIMTDLFVSNCHCVLNCEQRSFMDYVLKCCFDWWMIVICGLRNSHIITRFRLWEFHLGAACRLIRLIGVLIESSEWD